ncbi:dienelactone hydrolase family protein [Nocardioides sp. ChNu-153]|uniref:dienelactone hydrolase family protein n=1 Tax=unclassified Nocardioides TaxID=2615069 RepID=UPI00240571F0|nr:MULTISPECIES: dienelactone hydrolase family protein [unclassified Nocardioides]MDF9716830.1 dienelactone hydrolase family protein [Nocardioides sp. ChNu-99]MDN7120216.1 dienelactone hydrolase family protein [Nocardioides sp. ChNu-153]
MATVVLFHHAQGLTDGVLGFAERLREAGHEVHTPDLFDGRTFDTVVDGVNHVADIGFPAMLQRGAAAVGHLPTELVYAGFSLGVLPAQMLAQGRTGARGALLLEACVPPSEFGDRWPDEVPVQVHGMTEDPYFAGEGDLDVARALTAQVEGGELFLYPGDAHLFADPTLPSYDEEAAGLLIDRVLAFLERVDARA